MNADTALDNTTISPVDSDPIDLSDLLSELKEIKALLAEKSSAVMSRKQAANYVGISVAAWDRLVASHQELRPIHPTPGRCVWRKADLQAYLDSL